VQWRVPACLPQPSPAQVQRRAHAAWRPRRTRAHAAAAGTSQCVRQASAGDEPDTHPRARTCRSTVMTWCIALLIWRYPSRPKRTNWYLCVCVCGGGGVWGRVMRVGVGVRVRACDKHVRVCCGGDATCEGCWPARVAADPHGTARTRMCASSKRTPTHPPTHTYTPPHTHAHTHKSVSSDSQLADHVHG
jgi:hypothetical protein